MLKIFNLACSDFILLLLLRFKSHKQRCHDMAKPVTLACTISIL